jgi:hypothetical membrane protein
MATTTPRLGPLVHRSVHHAALLWLVGSVQFIASMIVVQLEWGHAHPYSLRNNYISDLGNTVCGYFPSGSTTYVCSPWHLLFNGSVIALGLLVILGTILVRTAFASRRPSSVGLGLIVLAGAGSIGVGVWPENVAGTVHGLSSAVAFLGGSLALIVVTLGMLRDTRWDGYRAYTLFSGILGLVASGLFETGADLGLGVGGMERLIVAPLLLWLIVASVHLLRVPQYAPRTIPTA